MIRKNNMKKEGKEKNEVSKKKTYEGMKKK